jgi:hypothetical protein
MDLVVDATVDFRAEFCWGHFSEAVVGTCVDACAHVDAPVLGTYLKTADLTTYSGALTRRCPCHLLDRESRLHANGRSTRATTSTTGGLI